MAEGEGMGQRRTDSRERNGTLRMCVLCIICVFGVCVFTTIARTSSRPWPGRCSVLVWLSVAGRVDYSRLQLRCVCFTCSLRLWTLQVRREDWHTGEATVWSWSPQLSQLLVWRHSGDPGRPAEARQSHQPTNDLHQVRVPVSTVLISIRFLQAAFSLCAVASIHAALKLLC